MATERILIDSSLIIDYFRKKNKENTPLWHLFQLDCPLFISTLTVYELLCGAKTPVLQKDTESLVGLFTVLNFGKEDAIKVALLFKELKQKNLLVGTIDILLAATAITNALLFATLNQEHFHRMPEVNLYHNI